MAPPKALAPMKTGSKPMRPVRANGKASAAKATRCASLSLPSGAGGGASIGQSIATVRVSVTAAVRGMSRCLRIRWGVAGVPDKGKRSFRKPHTWLNRKRHEIRGLGVPIRARVWADGFTTLNLVFMNEITLLGISIDEV